MTSPNVAQLRAEAEKCRKERNAIATENVRLRQALKHCAARLLDWAGDEDPCDKDFADLARFAREAAGQKERP